MGDRVSFRRLHGLGRLFGLLVVVLLAAAPVCGGDPKIARSSAALDLDACRQIAQEKQPALTAYRASAEATVLKAKALDDLRLAPLLAHDIPIRRQQSALGICITQARVSQFEQETRYAVTRTYLSALYARQQDELVDKALVNLKELKETVQDIVKDGLRKDVTTRDVDHINVLVLLALGKQEEAKSGRQRALAALRETMGVGQDFPLQLAAKELPSPSLQVKREQVLELAQAHRAELIQTVQIAEVFALEVQAQGKIRGPSARTFATGSDLHADPVPQGSQNGEYRPGAIGLEMPATLVGHQDDRIEVAKALETRAQAVVEKTRNLILLDAEDVFLRWQESSNKLARLREAADAAEKLARDLRDDFKTAGTKVRLDDVINAGILATQLRVEANETQHKYVLTLASLERVTGGGLKIDFGLGKPP
jgi:outer membrane protein TolC